MGGVSRGWFFIMFEIIHLMNVIKQNLWFITRSADNTNMGRKRLTSLYPYHILIQGLDAFCEKRQNGCNNTLEGGRHHTGRLVSYAMGKGFLVFVRGKVFVPSYIQRLCATVAVSVLCE